MTENAGGPFTQWCPELDAALRDPFPPELHGQKDRKGTFVAYQHYISRLNRLVGVGGWSMEPVVSYHAGNKLGLAVGVTILGVTRWNVGDEMEEHGEPDEDNKVRDFGSSSTNAWAQAFKRTCSLFGLGLYLYDKDWTRRYLAKASGNNGNGNGQRQQQRAPAADRQDNGADSDVPCCPDCGGPMWDNRDSKRNPRAPDFKCKKKQDCDGAIWLEDAA